jgi:exodeoxyribonuclease III
VTEDTPPKRAASAKERLSRKRSDSAEGLALTKRSSSGGRKPRAQAPGGSKSDDDEQQGSGDDSPSKLQRSSSSGQSIKKRPSTPGSADGDDGDDGKAKLVRRMSSKAAKDATPITRSETPRRAAQLRPSEALLRIIFVNVAGLRPVLNAEGKSAVLAKLIEAEDPDIVCMSEHKLKESDVDEFDGRLAALFPDFSERYWTCSVEKKGYSGVVMMVNKKEGRALHEVNTTDVSYGLTGFESDPIAMSEGRVITLKLPQLTVVACYTPNAGVTLQRLSYRVDRAEASCWDRDFTAFVNGLQASNPVVVVGDLNCCHGVRDIHNM